MQRWRGLEDIPDDWGRSVVTIGSYDGVHRGHQLIIRHAVDRARALGVPAVVVTFDPHPSEVVRPGSHPPLLAPHHRAPNSWPTWAWTRCWSSPSPPSSRSSPRPTSWSRSWSTNCAPRPSSRAPTSASATRPPAPWTSSPSRARSTTSRSRSSTCTSPARRAAASRSPPPSPAGWSPRATSTGAAEILGRPHRVEGRRPRRPARPRPRLPDGQRRDPPAHRDPRRRRLRRLAARPGRGHARRDLRRHQPAVRRHRAHRRGLRVDRVDLDLYGLHVAVDFLAFVRGQAKFDTLDASSCRWRADVDRCQRAVPPPSRQRPRHQRHRAHRRLTGPSLSPRASCRPSPSGTPPAAVPLAAQDLRVLAPARVRDTRPVPPPRSPGPGSARGSGSRTGTRDGSGGSPVRTTGSPGASGSTDSSARVYGCRGAVRTCSTGPFPRSGRDTSPRPGRRCSRPAPGRA
ncbi:hypothetical protein SVIOM74S_05093 [Streptomyces violarus]